MFRSTSSQDEESVFLDEGLPVYQTKKMFYCLFFIDDDPTFSTSTNNTDTTTRKMNSFFTENYDHENVTTNTTINDEIVSSNELKRRKSVSARFRSVSKDTM
jgi:hypothetical protein